MNKKRHRSYSNNSGDDDNDRKPHKEHSSNTRQNFPQQNFISNGQNMSGNMMDNKPNITNIPLLNNSSIINNPLLTGLLTALGTTNNQNFGNMNQVKNNKFDELSKFDKEFEELKTYKKNNKASNIVYVEGIPTDATHREVAHIFRPFPGDKGIRLITKEKNGENTLLAFVDFENIIQSTICINTLQGYRFDKGDLIGLHLSYGVSKDKP